MKHFMAFLVPMLLSLTAHASSECAFIHNGTVIDKGIELMRSEGNGMENIVMIDAYRITRIDDQTAILKAYMNDGTLELTSVKVTLDCAGKVIQTQWMKY